MFVNSRRKQEGVEEGFSSSTLSLEQKLADAEEERAEYVKREKGAGEG